MTGQALSTGHVIWAPVSVCVSQEWVGVAATSVKPTTTASLMKDAKVRHDFLEIYFLPVLQPYDHLIASRRGCEVQYT